jgi:ribosome recycling factor
LAKDGSLSSDELERTEKELDKITHDQVATIDQLLTHKEHELLQV